MYLFNCRNTDSAFTSELLRSLPREVVDADSVMSIFKQGLCDRTYTHKDKGKGTVIAQCGYSVLVEYEKDKLQLLTIPQLFEQRDTSVTYEATPKSKPKKSQERTEKKEKGFSAQEKESLLSKVTAGRTLIHNKFGKGVITKTDGSYVTIRFDGTAGEKKFDLVMAVQNGLIEI
ncbi:hypothetical protein SDC9_126980 [bioreactor metagenome]|uniref:Uncharacterized protein n=1 Tax=bioreactor metagenome TaxID=1076179 RepID=A0A645CSN6_9ZZZZ